MSEFLKINLKDLGKGFIVAALTAVVTGVYTSIQSGTLPDLATLKTIGMTALLAGISYLCKNLLTNSNDELLKKE